MSRNSTCFFGDFLGFKNVDMLDVHMMDTSRSNVFSISNPTPWPTIWVKPICLCFITENHTFPTIHGPILIPLSKPQVCENVFRTKTASFVALVHPIQPLLKHAHNDVKQQFTYFSSKCFVVTNAVPSRPSITRVAQRLFSRPTRSFGHPPLCLLISSPASFLRLATKDWLMPAKAATLWVETLILGCTKVWCFCSWDNKGIWLQMIIQIAPHILWNQGYIMHKKSHDV